MTFLSIYIIGVLLTALISLIIEHLYLGMGDASTVSAKDIGENLIYSLLSWLGLLGVMLYLLGEYICGFPQFGYGKKLHDYEESLKAQKGKKNEE